MSNQNRVRPGALSLLFAAGILGAAPLHAQVERPGDRRLDLPEFKPEEPEQEEAPPLTSPYDVQIPSFEPPPVERGNVLPPLVIPTEPSTEALAGGLRVEIREVRIRGNTVVPTEVLNEVTEPFTGRALSFADIEAMRDQLTLAYIQRGYVTSGAIIPDQKIEDGVLELEIVEGTLADVSVETDGRLRESFLRVRLEGREGEPVNVREIEQRLQLLQQDERILRVNAELVPGDVRGQSRLNVAVAEERPYWVGFDVSNHEPPSIGAYGGRVRGAFTNITGFGDSLELDFGATEGFLNIRGTYEIPLTRWDTTLDIHIWRDHNEVVEDPFDELNIENDTVTYGWTLTQPIYRSLNTRLALTLTGEFRRTHSTLDGAGFAFVPGPSSNGTSKVAVLRFGGEWTYRTRSQVFAARSLLSRGLDILDATSNPGKIPDGEFLAWLGQFQWARRLPFLDSQVIARLDAQVSSQPLLGLEQFAVGGHATVRGYSENQLVRDQGVVGSVEFRIPVWQRSEGLSRFELAPFIDVGWSQNRSRGRNPFTGEDFRDNIGKETLVGMGLGARWNLNRNTLLQFYWGGQLREVDTAGDYDIQDDGLHFSISSRWP